jgi:hypothetical protein
LGNTKKTTSFIFHFFRVIALDVGDSNEDGERQSGMQEPVVEAFCEL